MRTALFYLVLLSSLLLVGCGGGDSDFVVNPGGGGAPAPAPPNPTPGTTGNLVFAFTKVQSALTPTAAVSLEFEFSDSADRSVFSAESIFATSVTVRDVPETATRVEITAYGPGRVPLGVLSVPVRVTPDQTVTVDLGSASFVSTTLDELVVTPAGLDLVIPTNSTATLALSGTFSTGDKVKFNTETGGIATYTPRDASVVRAESTGLVTGLKAGSTVLDVYFTIQGKTATATVPIQVSGELPPVSPERLVLSPAIVDLFPGSSLPITATYFSAGSATGTDVTPSTAGIGFSGVTYDRGTVTVASGTAAPSAGNVTVAYLIDGRAVLADLRVTVSVRPPTPPAPGKLELEPKSLTFTTGGRRDPGGIGVFRAYFTPLGATQRLDVTESVTVDWSNFSNPATSAGSFGYAYRTVPVLLGLNEEYGTVFTTGTAPPSFGDTATMTVTYVNGGVTYADTAAITIGAPSVRSVDFVEAPGGTLKLPTRTRDFPMMAFLNYTSGLRQSVPSCGCSDPYGNYYFFQLEKPDTTNAQIDDGTNVNSIQLLDTRGQAGTATVALYSAPLPIFPIPLPLPPGFPITISRLGSFTLQVLGGVTSVDVALAPATITVNQRAPYTITGTYSDGTTQDLTAVWDITIPAGAGGRDYIRAGSEPNGSSTQRVYTGIIRGLQTTASAVTFSASGFGRQLFTFAGVTRTLRPQDASASVTVTAVDPSFP